MTRSFSSFFWVLMMLMFYGVEESRAYTLQPGSDTLYVKEAVLAKNVVERRPVDVVQSFEVSDQEAWCFVWLYNKGSLKTITFNWYYEDRLQSSIDVKVGQSSNWRTYSSTSLEEGPWRVEITGPNGKKLKEIRFNVSS